jgi:hypothetical protein
VVTCVDDFPAACQSVQVYNNGAFLAQGVSSIDETIPISALPLGTTSALVNPFLTVVARDSSGQTVLTRAADYFVETPGALVRVANVPGILLDADGERLLFNDGSTGIRYRGTFRIERILVGAQPSTDVVSKLIPGGVHTPDVIRSTALRMAQRNDNRSRLR